MAKEFCLDIFLLLKPKQSLRTNLFFNHIIVGGLLYILRVYIKLYMCRGRLNNGWYKNVAAIICVHCYIPTIYYIYDMADPIVWGGGTEGKYYFI